MKKLFVTICLVTAFTAVIAQDESKFHFGLKAAPSFAWLKTDSDILESNGSKFGFTYGLITEFNFADRYALATGVDITYRGGKFKSVETEGAVIGTDTVTVTTSTDQSLLLQYIEIPVTLKLKTNEIGYLTYYLQAGVAPGVNIRARGDFSSAIQTKYANGTIVNSNVEDDDVDVKDDINNVNLSMIIGGGVEYTLSGSTVLLAGIQFNNGFMDVLDGDEKANSNYLAITLGVLF
jgi:hypothetical protein